jgi:small subunit ribosomal protein S21
VYGDKNTLFYVQLKCPECKNVTNNKKRFVKKFGKSMTLSNFAVRLKINYKQRETMIVVPVKEGENIEKALKKFKRKFEKTGVVKELRGRQAFCKPSVEKRKQRMKAIYVEKLQSVED